MQAVPANKSLLQRQIPTIIGLAVLVLALVGGMIGISRGGGVFAPRASPQTTPKDIKLTNVTDNSFTVSFLTDESTAGFVKYGTEANSLKSQASDDRDQLSGSVSPYTLHHITVRGLQAKTTYHYTLGTGSNASFDNNGQPFTVTTAQRGGVPAAAKTIYGTVLNEKGSPADGSIVYVSIPGVGELSSLVKASGSWAIPLSNARSTDGSKYATTQDTDQVNILVQGPAATSKSQLATSISQAQPVPSITLGKNEAGGTNKAAMNSAAATQQRGAASDDDEEGSSSATSLTPAPTPIPVKPGGLNNLVTTQNNATGGATLTTTSAASGSAMVLDLTKTGHQTLETTQPVITGKAAPNVEITIEVNSETKITQKLIANADGTFSLDIEALEKELEPGEHTVTYSYVDPTTKKTVTKTQTFTVKSNTSNQLAQAPNGAVNATKTSTSSSTSTTPFGSGNPFPLSTPTPTATSSTKTATSSTRTTVPATKSAMPVSGSVHTTLALIMGGLFFILAGSWSFLIAKSLEEVREEE